MTPLCMFCWKLERYMRYGRWSKDISYFLWRRRVYFIPLPAEYQAQIAQRKADRRKRKEDPTAGLPDTAAYWWDVKRRRW